MTKQVTVAATQMSCTRDSIANIENAKKLTRQAASDGAQIILIQELFESVYFPCLNKPEEFTMAKPYKDNPLLQEMSVLARELSVVLPTSFLKKTTIHTTTLSQLLMPMDQSVNLIENHTYLMDLAMKRNITFTQEIPDLKFSKQNMQKLVWVSAGINGFLKHQELWR